MKMFCALFVCLLLSFAVSAQTSETENKTELGVEEITLSRDDGSGQIGDEAESFVTTDVPIHCSILLNSMESATVKMNLVVVKATGLKPESKIITVSYKTNGKQNRVNFTTSPEKFWTEGKYRVDIFIDGKISESKEFEITKAVAK